MKIGITSKLFLAILATSAAVALAMGIAVRISFTRGFLGYLNEQEMQRVEQLVFELAELYRREGSWAPVRANPRVWRYMLRPHTGLPDLKALQERRPEQAEPRPDSAGEPPRAPPPSSDLMGLGLRLSLLDAEKQLVAGMPLAPRPGDDMTVKPVEVDGRAVGWVAVVPFQQVSSAADLQFQERQLKASWLIGGFAVLLAAAVALGLARMVLAPVKRIAAATRRLAAGDYAERIQIGSHDELGGLAQDFNRLAGALEKNEQLRRALMADISHELRTPLAVLRGELEAMEDGVRPLDVGSVRSLQAEVASLSKLVDDLYELSLADVGALTYRKAELDLGALLQQALDAFREPLLHQRLALEAALPPPGWDPLESTCRHASLSIL